MANLNKWDYSGVDEMCFSDEKQESYKKAAEFLGDSVEDWGGGTGWAKRYFKNYKNIDGSLSKSTDVHADLTEYTSDCDNILIRWVLETNPEWKTILENAKRSFRKRFCLVICNPFVKKTRIGVHHIPVKADGSKMEGEGIVEMYFARQDLLDCFPQTEYRVKEETIKVTHGYGRDWILYVEKI